MPYTFNPFTNNLDAVGVNTITPSTLVALAGDDALDVGPNGVGVINLISDGTLSITGNPSTNTLNFSATAAPFPWTTISANQTLVANQGYIIGTSGLTLLMPSNAVVGSVIKISCPYAFNGQYVLTQDASTEIEIGNIASTFGEGGSVLSEDQGAFLVLVCTINEGGSTLWSAESAVGNFLLT